MVHMSSSARDWRTVRHRRLASSRRPDIWVEKLLTFFCTKALAPRHKLAVTSWRAQFQIRLIRIEVRRIAAISAVGGTPGAKVSVTFLNEATGTGKYG